MAKSGRTDATPQKQPQSGSSAAPVSGHTQGQTMDWVGSTFDPLGAGMPQPYGDLAQNKEFLHSSPYDSQFFTGSTAPTSVFRPFGPPSDAFSAATWMGPQQTYGNSTQQPDPLIIDTAPVPSTWQVPAQSYDASGMMSDHAMAPQDFGIWSHESGNPMQYQMTAPVFSTPEFPGDAGILPQLRPRNMGEGSHANANASHTYSPQPLEGRATAALGAGMAPTFDSGNPHDQSLTSWPETSAEVTDNERPLAGAQASVENEATSPGNNVASGSGATKPNRRLRRWTTKEDDLLRQLRLGDETTWSSFYERNSEQFPGRTLRALSARWWKLVVEDDDADGTSHVTPY